MVVDSNNNKLNPDPNLDPNPAAILEDPILEDPTLEDPTLEWATLTLEDADSLVVRASVTVWEFTQILTTLLDLSNVMAMAELFANSVME